MAIGEKVYLADKPTLDEVKNKIGATNDGQSSSTTTGSVFAKLNYIVSQLGSYLSTMYSWVSTLLSRIGNQTDSASSATTSNLHQKTNWILECLGTRWTDARAAKIDTIGSIVDVNGSRYKAIMGKLKKATPTMADYSRAIQVDNKRLYTIGNKYISVFDTDTFEQVAISLEQTGGCNRFFLNNGYLYYMDAIGNKIVKINATTLSKVIESMGMNDYALCPCMADGKIYYSPNAYRYIVAFDAGTLAKISQSATFASTVSESYAYGNVVYVWLSKPTYKLVSLDGTTLVTKKEMPVSFETFSDLYVGPICVYAGLLYCSITYTKSDGKFYGKIATFNPTTLELNPKESMEFQFAIYLNRCTVKNNLLYIGEYTDNPKIFTINMDTMAKIDETEPLGDYLASICLDECDNLYYSGIRTKKVYSLAESNYVIKGYAKEG